MLEYSYCLLYDLCAVGSVCFGLVWCFSSALSFPPYYYDGECNVFADRNWSIGRLKKLILTNDEVSELCRRFLFSCLIYESRGLRPHVVRGPFQIWEPGFERYSGYPSICPNFLPLQWILVQDNGPHLMDIETKVEVIQTASEIEWASETVNELRCIPSFFPEIIFFFPSD